MVCAGGGAGLEDGADAGTELLSGAGAGCALRTLLTRSVSRDTDRERGGGGAQVRNKEEKSFV